MAAAHFKQAGIFSPAGGRVKRQTIMTSGIKRALLIFVAGLVLGAVAGFYLGWVAFPVELVDVVPADLEEPYQQDYLQLIAVTYRSDGNLALARNRISSLGKPDWRAWLLEETVDEILTNPAGVETRQLVELAAGMGLESPAFDPYLQGEP